MYLKYGILVTLLLLCFCGVDSVISGWSPWEAFSLLRAGNFRFSGLLPGVVLLVAILVGMALCDRFFCRFLRPMGAVFSLLPVIPLFSVHRSRQNCAKGCAACKRVCPSDLEIPEDGAWETAGDCLQCQKCIHVCPKKNVHSGKGVVRGSAIWTTILRAAILAALLVLAGL
ncbi:MAG: hypothetical protein LUC50_00665 [Ruminococcus sp.]|nr:hypothetical protein [Ruminococcus sp.]